MYYKLYFTFNPNNATISGIGHRQTPAFIQPSRETLISTVKLWQC